jgi:hypothetical protein
MCTKKGDRRHHTLEKLPREGPTPMRSDDLGGSTGDFRGDWILHARQDWRLHVW